MYSILLLRHRIIEKMSRCQDADVILANSSALVEPLIFGTIAYVSLHLRSSIEVPLKYMGILLHPKERYQRSWRPNMTQVMENVNVDSLPQL